MSNDTSKRWELIKQAEQNAKLHKQALSLEDISNYWGSMTPEQKNSVIGGVGGLVAGGAGTALMDHGEEGRSWRILRNAVLAAGAGAAYGYNKPQIDSAIGGLRDQFFPTAQADETATPTETAPATPAPVEPTPVQNYGPNYNEAERRQEWGDKVEVPPAGGTREKGAEAISLGYRMAKQAVGKKPRRVLIGPDGKASVRKGDKKNSVKKKTRKYKGNEKQGQSPMFGPGWDRFKRTVDSFSEPSSSSASPTGNMPGSWFPPKPPKAPTGGSPRNFGPNYNAAERGQEWGDAVVPAGDPHTGRDRNYGPGYNAAERGQDWGDAVVPGGGKPSPSAGGYVGWKKRNPGAAYGKFMNQFPDAKVTEKGYRTLDVPSRGLSSAAPQFPQSSGPQPRLFPIRRGNPFNR